MSASPASHPAARRRVRRSARAALAVVLCALAGAAAAPAAGAASRLYFGALVDGLPPTPQALAPGGAFDRFEQQAGKRMSVLQWGQPWKMNGRMMPFQRAYFEATRRHGSIPVLDWGSWELGKGIEQRQFRLRRITDGAYDRYLRRWARDAKAWGHPFMLRFDHEMNGWWYPWGEGRTSGGGIVNGNRPGDFRRAWRHVHRIFERVGARNVTWLWSPNTFTMETRFAPLKTVYPGGRRVDWSGLSIYNKDPGSWLSPATLLTGAGTTWLANSYRGVLSAAPGKPVMLGETASLEAGDGGAAKAAWIRSLLRQLPTRFPQVRGFMWFDWPEAPYATLPIDSSPAAQAAFAEGVASDAYAGNRYRHLKAAPIAPPGRRR